MAKIFSPPKMPSLPPPVIVSAPEPVVTPTVDPTTPPASPTNETPEPTADELRVQNILTRRRGRLGTIGTSFRGVLADVTTPSRKTLLGE